MKVRQFINKYFSDYKTQATKLMGLNNPTLISNALIQFIDKFKTKQLLTEEDFQSFNDELKEINDENVKTLLIGVVNNIARNIFEKHKPTIESLVKQIEKEVNAGEEISAIPVKDINQFNDLLAAYKFNITCVEKSNLAYGYGMSRYGEIFRSEIPFALNVLMLTKQLPPQYCDIDLTWPIYPIGLVKSAKIAKKARY